MFSIDANSFKNKTSILPFNSIPFVWVGLVSPKVPLVNVTYKLLFAINKNKAALEAFAVK